MQLNIEKLSNHLFWDVDKAKIDSEKNKNMIIQRVLEYGVLSDWLYIKKIYGMIKIGKIALKLRDIDGKSLSFISLLTGIPEERFLCYTTKQSHIRHWIF